MDEMEQIKSIIERVIEQLKEVRNVKKIHRHG